MGNVAWAFTVTHQWHSVKCGIPPKIQPHLKSSHQFYQCGHIGRFITLWAPFLSLWQHLFFPNHHILGNFLKFVKIIHFSSEIIFGPLFIDIWRFFSGHTDYRSPAALSTLLCNIIYQQGRTSWVYTNKLECTALSLCQAWFQ